MININETVDAVEALLSKDHASTARVLLTEDSVPSFTAAIDDLLRCLIASAGASAAYAQQHDGAIKEAAHIRVLVESLRRQNEQLSIALATERALRSESVARETALRERMAKALEQVAAP